MKRTMIKTVNSIWPVFLSLSLLLLMSSVHAAPQVELEFESMFGQHGFFQNGSPPNGFISPTGVTFNANDDILIADQGNQQIQRCDLEGNCSWLGTIAFGLRNQPGTFDLPHGVEANRNGKFAVADEDNHAIQLCDFNTSCKFKGTSSSQSNPPKTGLGQWAFPDDVAFDSDDRVYGLDTGNNRVQILDPVSLDFKGQFGGSGSALGKFNAPKGISIDNSDSVYIADTGNNRVQICDREGDACTAFGSFGTAPGQFDEPVGIEVDNRGYIWVADTGNHRIQVCDKQGSCAVFGSFGTGEGQFDRPSDVAISDSGRLAVVDTNNNRIQFFATGPFEMNAGLNDAWFNPDTDGQGFFITVFPDLGIVLLAWFTYDTELPPADAEANLGDAGHRWFTAVGDINGNQAVMNIEMTSGGIFDEPSNVKRRLDGTITLTFEDCKSGTVEYNIPSINQQNTVPIQRVAKDNISLCENLQSP